MPFDTHLIELYVCMFQHYEYEARADGRICTEVRGRIRFARYIWREYTTQVDFVCFEGGILVPPAIM